MKLFRLIFKPETLVPMLGLIFASAATVALVLARIIWTGKLRYAFLAGNLFLAWLPLVFVLLAQDGLRENKKPGWQFFGWSAAWLLFFPNAPYICTDLIHLKTHFFEHFWVDMVLILLTAFTGLIIGFVSLYLMHGVVKRMRGGLTGWVFVLAVAGLSSFGIYLGRFLRFNSWDVIARPADLFHGIATWAADPLASPVTFAFPVLFAAFLFIAYVMLYALTHLPQMNQLQPST